MITHCESPRCWCGNQKLAVSSIIREDEKVSLYQVDGYGIYLSDGGVPEHWKDEADFFQQYPDAFLE